MWGGGAKSSHSAGLQAFTPAEVLITLTIIGVVAAMTMPVLISSYKKQIVETKLKKTYSVMNQALMMSAVDHGADITEISPSVINGADTSYAAKLAWFNEYLKPYLRIQNIRQNGTNLLVYLLDGSLLEFQHNGRDVHYYIDYSKGGLVPGRDKFIFAIYPGPECCTTTPGWRDQHYKNKPFVSFVSFSRNGADSTLASANGHVKIIQKNGWKIPDNYPLKF